MHRKQQSKFKAGLILTYSLPVKRHTWVAAQAYCKYLLSAQMFNSCFKRLLLYIRYKKRECECILFVGKKELNYVKVKIMYYKKSSSLIISTEMRVESKCFSQRLTTVNHKLCWDLYEQHEPQDKQWFFLCFFFLSFFFLFSGL